MAMRPRPRQPRSSALMNLTDQIRPVLGALKSSAFRSLVNNGCCPRLTVEKRLNIHKRRAESGRDYFQFEALVGIGVRIKTVLHDGSLLSLRDDSTNFETDSQRMRN